MFINRVERSRRGGCFVAVDGGGDALLLWEPRNENKAAETESSTNDLQIS